MRADVVQDQRARILDQQRRGCPRPRGSSPIAARVSASTPAGEEALQAAPLRVEHADRGVARAGQLTGDVEQPLEHDLEVELGHQRPPRLEQPPGLRGVQLRLAVGHRAALNHPEEPAGPHGEGRMAEVLWPFGQRPLEPVRAARAAPA